MSIPFNYRDLVILFFIALGIRLITALPQQQPNYMDAAYYYMNAVNLAEGRGFVQDFVWNYLNQPERPPQPSHLYWMPLPSILAALGMGISGIGYRSAQPLFILLSAGLVPLSYLVAWQLSQRRWLSWVAGVLALCGGFYLPYWTAIDTFTPFALFGALALFFTGQPKQETTRFSWPIIAGICAGLAHLTRADGPLIILTILIIYLYQTKYNIITLLILPLVGYSIIVLPWFIRNWLMIGAPLPPGGAQTIWLPHYEALFSYGQELSARTFLGQGIGPILYTKWWAFTLNIQRLLAELFMVFLLPLAIVGGWQKRDHPLVQSSLLYGILLFVAMTFVFTFPGVRGGLFHSAGVLLPFVYSVSVVGLAHITEWIAARRRTWDAQMAQYMFGIALVLFAFLLSSGIYYQRVLQHDSWNQANLLYATIANWIHQQNPQATVMINNPPMYQYHGGGLSVIIPYADVETTLQVIDQYQVDYLVLDRNYMKPLAKLYQQTETHPRLQLVKTFGTTLVFAVH